MKIGKLAQNSHYVTYMEAEPLLQRKVSFYLLDSHILHLQ